MKKYNKLNVDVQTFGHGRNKKFIIYADWDGDNYRWNTQVYPDIEGNTKKATAQALRWLNADVEVREPHIRRNNPSKFSIAYPSKIAPSTFLETDERGNTL